MTMTLAIQAPALRAFGDKYVDLPCTGPPTTDDRALSETADSGEPAKSWIE